MQNKKQEHISNIFYCRRNVEVSLPCPYISANFLDGFFKLFFARPLQSFLFEDSRLADSIFFVASRRPESLPILQQFYISVKIQSFQFRIELLVVVLPCYLIVMKDIRTDVVSVFGPYF
jgi:hypothetical protein